MTPKLLHYGISIATHAVVLALMFTPEYPGPIPIPTPTPMPQPEHDRVFVPIVKDESRSDDLQQPKPDDRHPEPALAPTPPVQYAARQSAGSLAADVTQPDSALADSDRDVKAQVPVPPIAHATGESTAEIDVLEHAARLLTTSDTTKLGTLATSEDFPDLSTGLHDAADGIRSPSYAVGNLTTTMIEQLRNSQQAQVIARTITGNRQWDFRIDGPLSAPSDARPVNGGQLRGFARRMVRISGPAQTRIAQLIHHKNPVAIDQLVVMLVFLRPIDDTIRQRQDHVAARLGVSVDKLLRTDGDFLVDAQGRINDFQIKVAHLRDGTSARLSQDVR